MRLASFFIGLGAIVLTTACSSETGIQEGVLDVGGSAGSSGSTASSGGAPSFGGSGGAPSTGGAAGRVDGGRAGAITGGSSNGGDSSGGSPDTGGASTESGGSAGAGASGDGGSQSSCSSSLSGQACTAGASCSYTSPDGCSAVNCLCSSGKWACAQLSGSCGKCPAAQQAHCGDPCSLVAQGCLCQCGGGPNFSGCSCNSGSWQCLGC